MHIVFAAFYQNGLSVARVATFTTGIEDCAPVIASTAVKTFAATAANATSVAIGQRLQYGFNRIAVCDTRGISRVVGYAGYIGYCFHLIHLYVEFYGKHFVGR